RTGPARLRRLAGLRHQLCGPLETTPRRIGEAGLSLRGAPSEVLCLLRELPLTPRTLTERLARPGRDERLARRFAQPLHGSFQHALGPLQVSGLHETAHPRAQVLGLTEGLERRSRVLPSVVEPPLFERVCGRLAQIPPPRRLGVRRPRKAGQAWEVPERLTELLRQAPQVGVPGCVRGCRAPCLRKQTLQLAELLGVGLGELAR